MTARVPCPPVPGPLEAYVQQFDPLFSNLGQRHGFRRYLEGLLLPRDRNKTLTALANTEPVVGAQDGRAQSLQYFLSESPWDVGAVNDRRLHLLLTDPLTAPHEGGVLVLDETGDRKDGSKTAHVGRQYLGSIGKIDNGIVSVSSLWADERVYYPLDYRPYTPAHHFTEGKHDPTFATKPTIARRLVDAALRATIPFRAVVADCLYGEDRGFEQHLREHAIPYVLAVKPSHSAWVPKGAPDCARAAAAALSWNVEERGDWIAVDRHFRGGQVEQWWAADLTFGGYGPQNTIRLVVATTDPATLPEQDTWYLITTLPTPESGTTHAVPAADVAEVVRLYGLRQWVEQSYKHVKGALGWADFQVRSDGAIRRHWQLVCCAFSFCWWALSHAPEVAALLPADGVSPEAVAPSSLASTRGGEKNQAQLAGRPADDRVMASRAPTRPSMADTLDAAVALLAGMVRSAPTAAAPGTP